MRTHGNTNVESMAGVPLQRATVHEEMAAYDALGPRTRAALDKAAPVKFLASSLLRQCVENGWDPQSPTYDARLASAVERSFKSIPSVVPADFVRDRVAGALAR